LIVAFISLTVSLSGSAFADTTLVAPLSVWKYDTGTDLGTAWTDTLYDDSGWASGPGMLGYGEPYIATTVPFGPDPNNKYPTCYFRIDFTYTGDPGSILGFVLSASYDDGFAAYLNGQEITRNFLAPGAPYSAFSTGSHEGGGYEPFDVLSQVGALKVGNNTLAVEVHQVGGNSSDLVMDMELTVSTTIEAIRGPYLQVGTPSSGIVRWRTNAPTDSRVRYGQVLGVWEGTVTDPTPTTEHEIWVGGLLPDTKYFYDVGTTAGTLAGGTVDHFFTTSPYPGTNKDTRVWLIGDSGTANADADSVRSAYAEYTGSRGTDLWIMLGDNAYSTGTDSEYQAAVFDMYPEVLGQCFLWPTRGNHDIPHAGPNNDYYEIFTLPTAGEAGGLASGSEAYYSFDYGNIHFICLDSEGSNRSTGGAMLTWLTNDLAATQQYWIIAYWHHPPYSKGSHDSDNADDSGGRLRDMRENALPILEAGGADAVFCGHSHSYERSFLLNGHYDVSSTLVSGMIADGGDGQITGDGAYEKPTWGQGPNEGAVYVVAGSSGKISGGALNHPVMVHASLNLLGSVVLDIDNNELHAVFIDDNGTEQDEFTIIKGTTTAVPEPVVPAALTLSAGFPNPFASGTRLTFSLPEDGPVRLVVYDINGRRVNTLVDGEIPEGDHEVTWAGTDREGRPVARGIYFAVLEFDGERRVRKLTAIR
jgi:hypothetical protein